MTTSLKALLSTNMSRLYSIFAVFLMAILSLLTNSGAEEQCPPRHSPIRERQGFYFRNHFIQNLTAYGENVCRIKCFLVESCKSYNFNASTNRCELNDADESEYPEDLVKRDGFVFVGIKECKVNSVLNCRSCVCNQVDCSEGTYYDKDTKLCVPCKKGSYQDKEGQEFCKDCPSGTDTLAIGAKSVKDCKEFCSSGEYSASGLATCIACPVGKYQSNNRSTTCLPCPAGTSTMHIGTRSVGDCKKFCSAGYFSTDGGLGACVPCPRGSYQPNAKGISCIKCPSGMTTADDGATAVAQCKTGCGMDFEHGKDHWTKTGTAFDNQPTYGDNPISRNRESSQHEGDWWIGGYENRPSPSMPAGQTQGDGPQGTLTSPSFLISGKDISFLIGGGCIVKLVRVELLIEGQVVRQETGKCHESMERRHWDVTTYQGKMAQVRIVDHSSGGWGHINFDDLRGDTCI